MGVLLIEANRQCEANHLSRDDVSVENASLARVHLTKSKCNQFGAGADNYLGCTGRLCPVTALAKLINVRHGSQQYFCIDSKQRTITKP